MRIEPTLFATFTASIIPPFDRRRAAVTGGSGHVVDRVAPRNYKLIRQSLGTERRASKCGILHFFHNMPHYHVSGFPPSRFLCTQVVIDLVQAANDAYALPGDRADASRWKSIFLETGGMRHLLDLILDGGGIDPSQVGSVCDSNVSIE